MIPMARCWCISDHRIIWIAFKIYVAHLREWRQQFQRLESVDLRYDHQIIVNPDLHGTDRQPPLSAAAARVAMAAGVKPAALVQHEALKPSAHPSQKAPVVIKPSGKPSAKSVPVKTTSSKHPVTKTRWAATHKAPGHAAAKTAKPPVHHAAKPIHNASLPTRIQPATSQKPSPAIAKGQDSH